MSTPPLLAGRTTWPEWRHRSRREQALKVIQIPLYLDASKSSELGGWLTSRINYPSGNNKLALAHDVNPV